MRKNKLSILTEELNELFVQTDHAACKALFEGIVNRSHINEQDKRRMLLTIASCDTVIKLQTYAVNSCFSFNGEGVI